jgi:hypothetical protein
VNFAGGVERMEAMEANLQRVNENVGAVSTNVDIVAAAIGCHSGQSRRS